LFEHELRRAVRQTARRGDFPHPERVILLVGERLRRNGGRHVQFKSLDTMSVRGAFAIGCSQIFASFAGISRSGISMWLA